MKSVEIITPQNITIEYQLASVVDRFLALLIDLCILFGYFFVITLFIKSVTGPFGGDLALAIFWFPVVFFYHLTLELFYGGQSFGKRAIGIKVVQMNGQNPAISECFLRWVFRIVDIGATLGALAALFVSSNEKAQRLGDVVAGTLVVKLNPANRYSITDIINIKSADEHGEFRYPQVTQLNDEDMLLIKNALERNRLYPNENHKQFLHALTQRVCEELKITESVNDQPAFLKSLLQEYIVLTR